MPKRVFQPVSEGMKEIGRLFEEEYFLAVMIVATEMFKKATKMPEPKLLEK